MGSIPTCSTLYESARTVSRVRDFYRINRQPGHRRPRLDKYLHRAVALRMCTLWLDLGERSSAGTQRESV